MNQVVQSDWSRPVVKVLEWMLILLIGVLVLDVLWGVTSRGLGALKVWLETSADLTLAFLPNGQSSWTEELARFVLIWISLLGAALAFERRGHLGVDYVTGKFHPDAQLALRLVSHLLVLIFAGLVLGKGGWMLVETTLSSGQMTPALGIQKWIVYAVIPVSGIFVILFTIQNMMTDLKSNVEDKQE